MPDATLEQKVERLILEVADLRSRIDALPTPVSRAPSPQPPRSAGDEIDAGEEIVAWMGKSSFLPRVSAICFLLVFALILRTVTDNGLIDRHLGSILGMSYAALLIFLAWRQYRRGGVFAPIFAVCGPVLMYIIVIETHARFESLPSVPAYVLLIVTGMAMATISYFHLSALPVLVGSLGMGIAAIGIDYPDPYYPHLALVLLVANLLGAFATRLHRCSWLRWILLLVTAATVLVWGIKLGIRVESGDGTAADFGLQWYLPAIISFGIAFFMLVLLSFFRRPDGGISRFDLALPAVSALWTIPAALLLARVDPSMIPIVGMGGILTAIVHLAAAIALVRNRGTSATGATALVFSAVLILALSSPAAAGGLTGALPLLSFAALGLLRLSDAWGRGSIRGVSYLLQVGVGTVLTMVVLDNPPEGTLLLQAVGGGIVGTLAMAQFVWCRRIPPPADSRLFGKWDKDDHGAVLLLMTSLGGFYFLVRSALWLVFVDAAGPGFVFQAGQSIVINVAAAALVLFSYRRKNKELRNLGIMVALVGGGRVFLGDLPGGAGVPLVGSVLSFGVAVSLVSFALTRWQKGTSEPAKTEKGEEASGCGKCA